MKSDQGLNTRFRRARTARPEPPEVPFAARGPAKVLTRVYAAWVPDRVAESKTAATIAMFGDLQLTSLCAHSQVESGEPMASIRVEAAGTPEAHERARAEWLRSFGRAPAKEHRVYTLDTYLNNPRADHVLQSKESHFIRFSCPLPGSESRLLVPHMFVLGQLAFCRLSLGAARLTIDQLRGQPRRVTANLEVLDQGIPLHWYMAKAAIREFFMCSNDGIDPLTGRKFPERPESEHVFEFELLDRVADRDD